MDERDPVELVDVPTLARRHEADGNALELVRPVALVPVAVVLQLEPVATHERPAARPLAYEPVRELQHLHAGELARFAVIAHRWAPEWLVGAELPTGLSKALYD